MAAEKNQRYLIVLMRSRIYGIDPIKLITPEEEQEALDWENRPPFPFDFRVDLPLGRLHAVELDSKIHLVGGLKYTFNRVDLDGAFNPPTKKVYELDLDKKEVEESKSIDEAPEFTVTSYDALHKSVGSLISPILKSEDYTYH